MLFVMQPLHDLFSRANPECNMTKDESRNSKREQKINGSVQDEKDAKRNHRHRFEVQLEGIRVIFLQKYEYFE